MTGSLIFVVGPSGVGKDTLLDGARHWLEGDSRFHFLRRDITRPESAGGEAHNPVSPEAFEARLQAGEYALHWGAHDLRYGLPHSELEGLERGRSVIANGSRSAVDTARRLFERVAIVSVTADEDLLRRRLKARAREADADIEKRIARATAFEVTGEDVHTIRNDGSVEDGVAKFVEVLALLDGRLFRQRPQVDIVYPRPGSYLITRRDQTVLFALTDAYNLPGGGIEQGETPEQALAREVLEETGCRLTSAPQYLCDASCYNAQQDGPSWHKLHRFFTANVEEVAAPTEPDHEPVWVNPLDIWDQLGPEIRYGLKQAGLRVPEKMPAQ
ncbi:MAG: phosphonate metabolism protein/1,5-bisphosphokinase (PRPP-forming) PhnN [Pseudomonadota bacterium]